MFRIGLILDAYPSMALYAMSSLLAFALDGLAMGMEYCCNTMIFYCVFSVAVETPCSFTPTLNGLAVLGCERCFRWLAIDDYAPSGWRHKIVLIVPVNVGLGTCWSRCSSGKTRVASQFSKRFRGLWRIARSRDVWPVACGCMLC